MTTNDKVIWTESDMIAAAADHWGDGFAEEDCEVVRDDNPSPPCLVVLHKPTGRTSDESGDAGRWNLDGTDRQAD